MTPTLVLEIIGTIAFAASGAMTAIKQKMDLFGVAILGLTTAVGGGIIRDLILSVTPPMTFRDPIYALTAIGVSLILFLPFVRNLVEREEAVYEKFMLWMDSIGLGIFTVIGVKAGFESVETPTIFLAVFVGVVTGVGGGVMRDVFADLKPSIFIKHFYATASLLGALTTAILWRFIDPVFASILGGGLIVLLRILAAKYEWNLPRAT